MKLRIVALIVALAASGFAQEGDAPRLIDFEIEDQLKSKHSSQEFADQVAVFLWADREGSTEHMDRWHAALEEGLAEEIAQGTVQLRGVAHVKGAPFFVKGKIRKRFGDDPQRWTLLDWKGVFASTYEFGEAHLVMLVFDAQGALRHRLDVVDMDAIDVDEVLTVARQLASGAAAH